MSAPVSIEQILAHREQLAGVLVQSHALLDDFDERLAALVPLQSARMQVFCRGCVADQDERIIAAITEGAESHTVIYPDGTTA